MKERLKVVSLDITYKCNFRCRHCYNSSGEHNFNNKELKLRTLKCAYAP